MAEQFKCNRTSRCTLCHGRNVRERRQTGPTENDVFYLCPVCDAPDVPKRGLR